MVPPNGIPSGSTLNNPVTGPVAQPQVAPPVPPPAAPVGPAAPVAPVVQLPDVPQYNLVTTQLGVILTPGESSQAALGLVLQPHNNFRAGAIFSTNFGDTNQLQLHLGGSIPLNDLMRLNIFAMGGFGDLSDSTSNQGRLQEAVLRNGLQGFLGVGAELETRLSQNFGLFGRLSLQRVFNGALESAPTAVSTGEELNPDTWRFAINLGISVGGVSRPLSGHRDADPTPPVRTQPDAPHVPNDADRLQGVVQDFNRQVADLRTSFTTQIEDHDRAQVDTAISSVQRNINDISTRISQLSGGINQVNRLLAVITRVNENFPTATSTLSPEYRATFTQALDQLENALRNSGSNPTLNAQLQNAFLYIPNADPNHPRMINSFVNRLGENEVEAVLRSHGEIALADRVRSIRLQCSAYASAHPSVISVQDLQREVATMEGSLTALSALVGPNLQQDPRWSSLRDALSQARDRVNMNYRTTLAYNRFSNLLSNFIPLSTNPVLARERFQQAAQFARDLGNQDATRGVTLAAIAQQFGPFTENSKYNLNLFIHAHTRPQMTSSTELRRWLPAVLAAHDLACQLDSASAACQAPTTGTVAAPAAPTPPAGGTVVVRTPRDPAAAAAAQAAARLRGIQGQVDAQARNAHGDATSARQAFNEIPAAHRGNIETIIQAAEAADRAAAAAATAARAPGVTFEVATQQLEIATAQAGIARVKMNEANPLISAAMRAATPAAPPPPPAPPPAPVVVVQPDPPPAVVTPPAAPVAPAGDAAVDPQGRPIRLQRRQH